MKVDRVLGIMELARPLLERYRGCSVEDMIIDLVAKCGGGAEMLEAASLAGARVGKPERCWLENAILLCRGG